MTYRFGLDKSSRKHICPNCKEKKLVRYVDNETGLYLADDVGRCDRQFNCMYHYTPKQYFQDNGFLFDKTTVSSFHLQKDRKLGTVNTEPSFISFDVFKNSLKNYDENYFVQYLIKLFGTQIAQELISKYYIGTSKHWKGATVFWQIDTHGKIRAGKIMLYNSENGKRIKEPNNMIYWIHKEVNLPNFTLEQCCFGEHLIDNKKPIALFESEKSAIIFSVYFPQLICLATSGLDGLSNSKCETLNKQRQKIILFPDLSKPIGNYKSAFEKWKLTAEKSLHNFKISDYLETISTVEQKIQGFDLADFLKLINTNIS